MPTNQDDPIEYFYSLKPTDFPNLVRLTITQYHSSLGNPPVIDVNMELSPQNKKEPRLLVLSFRGVINLKFNQPHSSLVQIIQIEITSIKDWQWENTRYKVSEVEDNIFSLMCKEFSVKINTNTE